MKQYHNILETILKHGVEKESGRPGMPNTIAIHGHMERIDLMDGFPLLTTKKMGVKSILHELKWFLSGDTNVKYLIDNKVNIWNKDCFKWFMRNNPEHPMAQFEGEVDGEDYTRALNEFVDKLKSDDEFCAEHGDLGRVYGAQWRKWRGGKKIEFESSDDVLAVTYHDQVADLVKGLRTNPYSRYHIISGWNPAEKANMALPPCHLLYQFHCRPLTIEQRFDVWSNEIATSAHYFQNYRDTHSEADQIAYLDDAKIPKYALDLTMFQRSCDTFLGVPYNIASCGAFIMILAKMTNMAPGHLVWMGGDVHVYDTHREQIQEQLSRECRPLPRLIIPDEVADLEDPKDLDVSKFELVDYDPHPPIKGILSAGV